MVTSDSAVLIHKDSPYYKSIKALSKKLGFDVQEHTLPYGQWTKDYVVSTGKRVIIPLVEQLNSDYFTNQEVLTQAKQNPNLYYGPLALKEHHKSKRNVTSSADWEAHAPSLFTHTKLIKKTILEGGNFFCAINNLGQRYYLVGENVISETMAFHKVTRAKIIEDLAEQLDCHPKFILFIPQWTYHLDLQMSYLGNAQFVIHSFDQESFDFGLDETTKAQVQATFAFLKEKFEQTIIDKACSILNQHGFSVRKVFGCLFYLENCADKEQLQYVPYCKSSEGFDGVIALMMNGIAFNLGTKKGRHFMTPRCDNESFRSQFEKSLKALGITALHDADVLDAYADGDFNGMSIGVLGATNVAQFAAFMNGSIRCQTSIVNKWHLAPPTQRELDLAEDQQKSPTYSLTFFSPNRSSIDSLSQLVDPRLNDSEDFPAFTNKEKDKGYNL